VVFAIQIGLDESASYKVVDAAASPRGTTFDLFLRHPRETGIIFLLTSGGSLAFYCYTTYMQKFLTNSGHFSKDAATAISAASLMAYLLVHPIFGWIGDHVGRTRLM